ncbi:unnamed protein product, partial [Effrenium voratum]
QEIADGMNYWDLVHILQAFTEAGVRHQKVSNRDLFLRLADALTAKTAKMAPKHVLDLLAVYEAADLRPRALYVELLHAVLRLSRSMYAEELTLTLQALARYNLGNPTVVSQLMRTVRNEIKEFRLRYLCASAGALGALHACPQELLDVLDQRARFEVDTISVQELLDNIQAFPQLEFSWQPYEDLCLTEFLQRLSKFRTAEEVDQLVSPFEVARFLQSRGLLSPEFLRALCQWSLKGAHRPNVRAERRPSTRQLLQLQDLCFEHGLEEEPALQDAIQYFVESAGGKWHSIYAKPLKYKRRRAYIRREDPLDGLELPELPEPVSRPKQLEQRPEDLAALPSSQEDTQLAPAESDSPSQETNALASFEDEGPRIKPSAPSPLLENEDSLVYRIRGYSRKGPRPRAFRDPLRKRDFDKEPTKGPLWYYGGWAMRPKYQPGQKLHNNPWPRGPVGYRGAAKVLRR